MTKNDAIFVSVGDPNGEPVQQVQELHVPGGQQIIYQQGNQYVASTVPSSSSSTPSTAHAASIYAGGPPTGTGSSNGHM